MPVTFILAKAVIMPTIARFRKQAICFAFLVLTCNTARATSEETLQIRWQELEALVGGKTVQVLLEEGIQVNGRVTSVTSEAMHMRVRDTSAPRNYPRGQTALPESSVQTIRYTTRRGPWRAIGTAAGAGAGFPLARAVSFGSGSKSISKTIVSHIVVVAVGAVIGYMVGRAGDRHHIVLKVVREFPVKRFTKKRRGEGKAIGRAGAFG